MLGCADEMLRCEILRCEILRCAQDDKRAVCQAVVLADARRMGANAVARDCGGLPFVALAVEDAFQDAELSVALQSAAG